MGRVSLPVLHDPPTLSKSGLLLSPCLAWAGPGARWYDEKRVDGTDTSKRDTGIEFHHQIDQSNKGKEVFCRQDTWKLLKHAEAWLTDLQLRSESVQSEVAISIHWEEGKAEILEGITDRNYPNRPGWQNGTADIVAILSDGTLLVADWKTGGTEGAEEQLLSLACGLQKVMPLHGDLQALPLRKVRIACVQVNEEGVWPHERDVPQAELDQHWDAMRFQWEDIGRRNDPVTGIHCVTLYCPHLGYCDAVSDGVRQLAQEAAAPYSAAGGPPMAASIKTYTDTPLSDRQAGETMAMISAARRQAKYVEAGLKKYIESGGHVTLDGYEWSEGNNGFRWRRA